MKTCCVDGCDGPNTPNPAFFEFPSSRLLRKRWLDAIKHPATEAGAVCIRHFARADYELVRGEARLKPRSVPSRKIPGESNDDTSESESDSNESATSDRTQNKSINNDNGNKREINNDNGNNREINSDNGDNREINNDNGDGKHEEHSKKENFIENGPTNEYNTCTVNSENRLTNEDNRKLIDEDGKINDSSGKTNDSSGKTNDDNVKTNDDNIKTNEDNGKINEGNEKIIEDNGKINEDHARIKDDNGKISEDIGKINDDIVKISEENGKIKDDIEKISEENGKIKDDIGKINIDNGNSIKKLTGRKTRCKITALRAINGRRKFSFSSDSTNSDSVNSSPRPELEGNKEDIEESLQHYYIENKKTERQVAAMTDVINEDQEKRFEESRMEQDSDPFEASPPVFIELSVGQGTMAEGQEPTEADCLMLLESVQCEVDPALLLAAREEDEENMEQVDLEDDDDDDELQVVEKKKEDPISLLTSSDEDEVIIQEPKYDTVEVSSADTSEDDMPLVRLLKPSNHAKKLSAKHTKNLITKLLWGRNDYYCVHCSFTTANASEYTKHLATHNNQSQHKIIQCCQDCGFTTSSKHQLQKHKQKHKNEKRFKCQMCTYSAKHKMSLVYHMKNHKNTGLKEVELAICGTYEPTSGKSEKSKKSKASESKVSDSSKRYKCRSCGYKTNRRSDLKRHRRRIHDGADDDDDDDDEYRP